MLLLGMDTTLVGAIALRKDTFSQSAWAILKFMVVSVALAIYVRFREVGTAANPYFWISIFMVEAVSAGVCAYAFLFVRSLKCYHIYISRKTGMRYPLSYELEAKINEIGKQ